MSRLFCVSNKVLRCWDSYRVICDFIVSGCPPCSPSLDCFDFIYIFVVVGVPYTVDAYSTFMESAGNDNLFTSRKHLRTKVTPDFHLTYSNQRTNGPVNAHLISWPSKAQNIQNLENIW